MQYRDFPCGLPSRSASALLLSILLVSHLTHGQPRLEVRQGSDAFVRVSWPGTDTGYALETSPRLGSAAAWDPVPGTPALVNGRFSVAILAGDQARYFRLRRTAGPAVTSILDSSPGVGETGVAVTRETIFRFSAPLAPEVTLTAADFFAEAGGREILARPELSSDRRTATLFYLENLPASARVRVTLNADQLRDASGALLDADGDGQPGGVRVLEFRTAAIAGLPNTAVIGRVFASEKQSDGSNRPLENVTITVDGAEETLRATTDATGAFTLSPAPAGRFFVHVDGRTAVGSQWPGGAYYPFVGKAWDAVAGSLTNLAGGSGEIYLPRIQSDALQTVSVTEATRVTFSPIVLAGNPELEGVEVNVPPNSLFSDNGARGGRVGIAPVPADRLPEPLPPGLDLPLVITVQTDGPMNFDQPVPVRFPNLPDPRTGVPLPPGAKTVLWSFNHDTGRWEPQGLMTISEDGRFAVSDPGVGIRQPGWHGAAPGSNGRGPRKGPGPRGDPSNNDEDGDGNPDCEGDDCECTQEITCVVPKEGANVALCALECLGNVVDDIFGDGAKPQRTAFETGLRCIGGPDKCPGRPEDTLDRKRLDCMDECMDPLPDRTTYVMPCEGFSNPCGAAPALQGPTRHADLTRLLPDRFVEQRAFWDAEGEFLTRLTGTPKILESDSAEIPLLTAFFDAFSDRVQPTGPSGIRLSAAERAELLALPRPAQFTASEWSAMIDRLESLQGAPLPADVAAAEKRLTDLTAELIRRGWQHRGDGLLHGLARRSKHSAPEVGSPEFPARAHFYYLKDHRNGFVQRGRLNPNGQFDGIILSPGGYYSVVYFDPVTGRAGAAFFQAREAGTATFIPTATLQEIAPTEADTDGDGLPDLAEKVVGTSPTRADSDDDGVSDGQELRLGTHPLDGVGLPLGVVGVSPTPGPAYDVAAGNPWAVLACTGGLAVFDVSNPVSPVQLAVLPGNATAVALQGSLALAAIDGGVQLIDLTNPANPTVLWRRTDLGRVGAVALGRSWAFVGAERTLHRLDLTSGDGASLQNVQTTVIESLLVRGDLVYALGLNRLTVYRAEDLLEVVQSVNAPGSGGAGNRPRRLFLDGTRLYAQHNFGFNVFDLSDPVAPVLAADRQTPQAGWRQFVPTGTGLALAAVGPNSTDDGPHDVSLYRVTAEGLDVQFVSTFVTPGEAYAVAIAGARGYVADGTAGLTVLNYLAPDLDGIPPAVSVAVDSLVTPPRVEGGTTARVAAVASDDIAVRHVDFIVDGQRLARDDSYPFEVFLPVPPASPANPALRVRVQAEDTAGNVADSAEISVGIVVDATPPGLITLDPMPGATIPISAITDIVAVFREPVVTPVTPATLTLRASGPDGSLDTADDQTLTGEIQWIASDNTIRLRLPTTLDDVRYRATLAAGLADAAGNARPRALTWEFVTGSPPGVLSVFPPSNYVDVGGTLNELAFDYDQPVSQVLLDTYRWQVQYRSVPATGGTLGPAVDITPITATRSPNGRTVRLHSDRPFAPGFYRVTGNGPVLSGIFWEFYFRDVPNEAVSVNSNGEVLWKYPPGAGIGDELIINLPGQVAAVSTHGLRSLLAYSDVSFLRQTVNLPTPVQLFGGLRLANTSFGPGVTDVHGPLTLTGTFTEASRLGPHTLNLRGGGLIRARLDLDDPNGVLLNHPGSTVVLTNLAAFHGPASGGRGGRVLNLGTLRSVATGTTAIPFDDLLLRNDGLIEIASGTLRAENLENEGTVSIAEAATLMLPARLRGGVSSRITGVGAIEFGEYDASRRRVLSTADAEIRGDLDVRGPVTLVAGTVTLWKPWVRPAGLVELRNHSTLRLVSPSRIGELALTDGNLDFNSDAEIGTFTVGSRADLRSVTRVRITGDARIHQGLDALGPGLVEFTGTTVVTNGTQSSSVFVGHATLRNTGTWRQAVNSSQGSFLIRGFENGQGGTGAFENAGVFEMITERPLGVYGPFRNHGRMILSRATVAIDARQEFLPPRQGAFLPQPGSELILNNTTVDHSGAGTLDLAAGTVRGTGSILAVNTATAPKILNRAVLRPGPPNGTLTLRATGGFEQTATGELIITLSPAGATSLRLDRTPAMLAGTLTVELADGFSPAVGQSFSVMTYTGRTGEFTTLKLPDLGAGLRLEVVYESSGVTVRVVGQ